MEQRSAVPLTSAGCFAAVLLIIAAVSVYVPLFRPFGLVLIPLPLLLMYMKFSLRYAVLTAVAGILLMAFFLGPVAALMEGLMSLVGLALGIGFRRNWNSTRLLVCVTAALVVIWSVGLAISFVVSGINPITEILQNMNVFIDEMMAAQQSQMSLSERMQYASEMEVFKTMMPAMIPFVMCMGMAIIGYVNIKVSQLVLKRMGIDVKPFLPIRYWEIPRVMIYLYVLGMVMKYWGTTRQIDWLVGLGLNLYGIGYFFITFAGLAFVFALLHQRFKLRTSIQVLLAIFLFVFPPCALMLFFLGLFDMLWQYRKKHDMV